MDSTRAAVYYGVLLPKEDLEARDRWINTISSEHPGMGLVVYGVGEDYPSFALYIYEQIVYGQHTAMSQETLENLRRDENPEWDDQLKSACEALGVDISGAGYQIGWHIGDWES